MRSTTNFKNLKFTRILSDSQLASQPAVRPGSASAMTLEFLHNKVIYKTVVPKNVYPLCHGVSVYLLLVSFCLQIAHKKVRKL